MSAFPVQRIIPPSQCRRETHLRLRKPPAPPLTSADRDVNTAVDFVTSQLASLEKYARTCFGGRWQDHLGEMFLSTVNDEVEKIRRHEPAGVLNLGFPAMKARHYETGTAYHGYSRAHRTAFASETLIRDVGPAVNAAPGREADPVDVAIDHEAAEFFADAIARRLTPTQTANVQGIFYENRIAQDVAKARGVARPCIDRSVHDSIRNLRNEFNERYLAPEDFADVSRKRCHWTLAHAKQGKNNREWTDRKNALRQTVAAEYGAERWTVLFGMDEPAPACIRLTAARSNRASVRVQWYDHHAAIHKATLVAGATLNLTAGEFRKVEVQGKAQGQRLFVTENPVDPVNAPSSPPPSTRSTTPMGNTFHTTANPGFLANPREADRATDRARAQLAAAAILATPANKLATDADGKVAASNGSGATVNVTTETTALRTA